MNENFENKDSLEPIEGQPHPMTNGSHIDRSTVDGDEPMPSEPIGQGGLQAQAFGKSVSARHDFDGGRETPSGEKQGIGSRWSKGVSKFREAVQRSVSSVLQRVVNTPARWNWNQAYDEMADVEPTWRKRPQPRQFSEPEGEHNQWPALRTPKPESKREAAQSIPRVKVQRKVDSTAEASAPMVRTQKQAAPRQQRPMARVPATFIKRREITRAAPKPSRSSERQPIRSHIERRITSDAAEPVVESSKWSAYEYASTRQEQPQSASDLFAGATQQQPRQRELKPAFRSRRNTARKVAEPINRESMSRTTQVSTPHQSEKGDRPARGEPSNETQPSQRQKKSGFVEKSKRVLSKGKNKVFRKSLPETNEPSDVVQPADDKPITEPKITAEPSEARGEQHFSNVAPDISERPTLRRESDLVFRKTEARNESTAAPTSRMDAPRTPEPVKPVVKGKSSKTPTIQRSVADSQAEPVSRSTKFARKSKRIASKAKNVLPKKSKKQPARQRGNRDVAASAPDVTAGPISSVSSIANAPKGIQRSSREQEKPAPHILSPVYDSHSNQISNDSDSPLETPNTSKPSRGIFRRMRDMVFRKPVSSSHANPVQVSAPATRSSQSHIDAKPLTPKANNVPVRNEQPVVANESATVSNSQPRQSDSSEAQAQRNGQRQSKPDTSRRPVSRIVQRSRGVMARTRDFVFRRIATEHKPAKIDTSRATHAQPSVPAKAQRSQPRPSGSSHPVAIQRVSENQPSVIQATEKPQRAQDDDGSSQNSILSRADQRPLKTSSESDLTLAHPQASVVSRQQLDAPSPKQSRQASEKTFTKPPPQRKAPIMRSTRPTSRRRASSNREETALVSRGLPRQSLPSVQSKELPLAATPLPSYSESFNSTSGDSLSFEIPTKKVPNQNGANHKSTPPDSSVNPKPMGQSASPMVYRKPVQEVQPHSHDGHTIEPMPNGKNGHVQRVNNKGAAKQTSKKSARPDVSPATPESLKAAFESSKKAAGNGHPRKASGRVQRDMEPVINSGEPEKAGMGHQEFEDLASKMYAYIKQKLEVERERHGKPGLSLWP